VKLAAAAGFFDNIESHSRPPRSDERRDGRSRRSEHVRLSSFSSRKRGTGGGAVSPSMGRPLRLDHRRPRVPPVLGLSRPLFP
jgi:hypothetical protein